MTDTDDSPDRTRSDPTERSNSDSPTSTSECHVETGRDAHRRDALDVTYEEARRVVEYQLDSVSDIDSKAAHTLRVLFVVFGLLVTAVSVIVNTMLQQKATDLETAQQFVNSFTAIGIALLLFSLLVAIWTYNETHTKTGPRERTG